MRQLESGQPVGSDQKRPSSRVYLGPRLASLATHGLAQLVEGAGLDLPHTLSADPEVAAQLLQRLRFFGAACAA